MDKTYDPASIEQRIYRQWESAGYFAPSGRGEPYCIMIPPPNVTGTLHMGHAFQHTIMDALTRYYRMQGRDTLWQPGTDHADRPSSIVKRSRVQSTDEPMRRICSEMMPPECAFQSHTRSRNAARPRS